MKQKDFFELPIGSYNLTDNIYQYTLTVDSNQNGDRYYKIKEKGSPSFDYIFMIEDYEEYEDGEKRKFLYAIAGVGGLTVHSSDVNLMIRKLKLIE